MATPSDLQPSRHLVVSQRLRQRRRTLGLTQKQVVTRLARLGVTTSNKALSSLEHGAGLDLAKLPELARALECSITWLLGLTEDPHGWDPDPALWGPEPPRWEGPNGPGPGNGAHHAGPRRQEHLRVTAQHAPTEATTSRSTPSAGQAHRSWILGPLPPEG